MPEILSMRRGERKEANNWYVCILCGILDICVEETEISCMAGCRTEKFKS